MNPTIYLADFHWRNIGPQHGLPTRIEKAHKSMDIPPLPRPLFECATQVRAWEFPDRKRHRLRRQCDGLTLPASVICVSLSANLHTFAACPQTLGYYCCLIFLSGTSLCDEDIQI